MKSFVSLVIALFCSVALGEKSYVAFKDTPAELRQALKITYQLDKIENSADLKLSLVLETLGSFKIFEESLGFENLSSSSDFVYSELSRPKPTQFIEPITQKLKTGFKGQSEFVFLLSKYNVSQAFKLGVRLQVCSDKICLFPSQFFLEFPLAQVQSHLDSQDSATNPDESLQTKLKNSFSLDKSSFWVVSLFLLFSGLITAFTPCVYPLYPITLGIFSRWATQSQGKSNPFAWALVYCGGITLSYAALGLVTAATGSLFGSFTQQPAFLFSIATVILFSAIVFSGVVEIPFLSKIQAVFSKPLPSSETQAKPKMLRIFLMGATLGLVASPCVGPVLVTLLAWLSGQLVTGSAKDYLLGFYYLALFGAGMCLPFLVMGHFVFKTNRSLSLGKWTRIGKVLGSALMIFASLYFYYMGAKSLSPKTSNLESLFTVSTLNTWDKSKASVIDFRAEWCVACHELEQRTFSDPRVARLFQSGQWNFVKVDLTNASTDPEQSKIADEYNVISLPKVMIWNGSKFCDNLTLYEFESAESFLNRIAKSANQCEAKESQNK